MKTATLALAIALALAAPLAPADEIDGIRDINPYTLIKHNVIPEVWIPPEGGTAATYSREAVQNYLRTVLIWTIGIGHDLTRAGELYGGVFMEFMDIRSPFQPVKLYLFDSFLIRFSDNSSVECYFVGPYVPSGMFQVLRGTERDPLGEPYLTPAGPPDPFLDASTRVDPSGYFNFTNTWMGIHNWGVQKYGRNQR